MKIKKSKQESKNSTNTKIKSQRKKETNNTIIGQIQGVILRLDKAKIKNKKNHHRKAKPQVLRGEQDQSYGHQS